MIPLQARCGPEGGQRYSSTLPRPRHQKVVSGQQHTPAALYPRERAGTHFTGGWVGPRAGLDGQKISSPPRFDPGPSSPQSVAIPTELPGPHIVRTTNIKIKNLIDIKRESLCDGRSAVRIPGRERFCLPVQTCLEAHPTSYPPPSSVEVVNQWSYTSNPPPRIHSMLAGELYISR